MTIRLYGVFSLTFMQPISMSMLEESDKNIFYTGRIIDMVGWASAANYDRGSSSSHQAVYTLDTPGPLPKEVLPNSLITTSPKSHPLNLSTENPSRPTTTVPTSLMTLGSTTALTFKQTGYPSQRHIESLTKPSPTSNCYVQLAITCDMASA